MVKIFLNVLEVDEKFKGHSYYKELIRNPPVKYVNLDNNFSKKNISPAFLSVAKKIVNLSKIPNYWNVKENCDLIHSGGTLISNKKPWVIDFEINAALTGFNVKRLNSFICKNLIKKSLSSKYCKKIMPWSEAGKKSLINYIDCSKFIDKIEVVYPAISLQKLKKKRKSKIKLLFVGKNFLAKGGKEALEVFRLLDKKYDLEFDVISEVPKVFLKKYDYKNIRFYNYIPREEIYSKFYPNADIYFMPTHYDTFGMSFLEAMSFGLPIISTNVFAVPEIVTNNGLLSDVKIKWFNKKYQIKGDWNKFNKVLLRLNDQTLVNDLYKNLSKLIEDTKLRKKLGNNSRKEIESGKFSVENRNSKLKNIYGKVLKMI